MPKSQAQKEADRRYEKAKGKERKKRYRDKLKKGKETTPPAPKTCSICGGVHHAKGLCYRHYRQALRAAQK